MPYTKKCHAQTEKQQCPQCRGCLLYETEKKFNKGKKGDAGFMTNFLIILIKFEKKINGYNKIHINISEESDDTVYDTNLILPHRQTV